MDDLGSRSSQDDGEEGDEDDQELHVDFWLLSWSEDLKRMMLSNGLLSFIWMDGQTIAKLMQSQQN